MGEKIGATKATISNLENNNKKPSLDLLISLASYFNTSIDYLIDDPDPSTMVQKKLTDLKETAKDFKKKVHETTDSSNNKELKEFIIYLDDSIDKLNKLTNEMVLSFDEFVKMLPEKKNCNSSDKEDVELKIKGE